MTREEFINGYCERSGYTWADLHPNWLLALPCACGRDGCEGWAMVSNNPHSLKAHADLYAPPPHSAEDGS